VVAEPLGAERSAEPLALEVGDDEISALLAPFIAREMGRDGRAWRVLERRLRVAWFFSWLRSRAASLSGASWSQSRVAAHYGRLWAAGPTGSGRVGRPTTPCLWGTRALLADARGLKRVQLLYLMRLVGALAPASVLEVGFGNGQQLLPLAARFPHIRFAGVELTIAGVGAARAACSEPELPRALRDYAPESLVDLVAPRRLALVQGDASALPFADASFDLVYTVLALEQMEPVREAVLAEIARVARAHAAMIEPFREWNASGLRRNFIRAKGYFSGRIADLPRYGLEPVLVTDELPTKLRMGVGLVVAAVTRRSGASISPTATMAT